MIQTQRGDSNTEDFIVLVQKLDASLAITDGDEHTFYDQFNKITNIKHAIVAYENNIAVGCGAIKKYNQDSMEVKRMFVEPDHRNKGIAKIMLTELEAWAKELGATKCILETGIRQVSAIHLYKNFHYTIIPNYGQYANVENSVCFEKKLV
jgi:GNAT superfamily N-acetyltransferase